MKASHQIPFREVLKWTGTRPIWSSPAGHHLPATGKGSGSRDRVGRRQYFLAIQKF